MKRFTKIRFDYESKIWGEAFVGKYTSFQSLDLKIFDQLSFGKLSNIKKVIDLGSGAGNIAGYLKSIHKNWNILGIDISKNATKFAKKLYPSVRFKIQDASNINYKNIDLVYAFDTLEHFFNLEKIINKVNLSLRDGGIFYVAIPLEKQFPTPYYFLNKFGWEGKKIRSGHVNVFNDKEFIHLVERNGFKLISKKYSYHLLMSIFDIVFYVFQNLINKSIAFESSVNKSGNLFLKLLKNIISIIGYVESSVFGKFVGGKGHFLFVKNSSHDFFSVNPPITVSEKYQIKWGLKKVVQPRDIEIKKLFKKLNFSKMKNILDFGCANGVWLERILSENKKAKGIGVDISPYLINIANNREKVQGKYILTNKKWLVKTRSIDFCYSFDTLEHVDDKENEIKKIYKSLKKGGKVLIYTLNPNNKYTIDWFFEILGSNYMYKRADHDKKLFISPQNLERLLIKQGFSNSNFILYDGPANLIGRVLGYIMARFNLNDLNDKLIRIIYPLNNFIDGLFIKKGYSNGYFLWATKK